MKSLKEKFDDGIVAESNGCWIFKKNRGKEYGRIFHNKKRHGAHRVSLCLYRGFDLNSKLFVCHHCDNPICVNPDHLFVGTQKYNINDRDNKGRNGMSGRKISESHRINMSIGMKKVRKNWSNRKIKTTIDQYIADSILLLRNELSQRKIADLFGIKRWQVRKILDKSTYNG